MFLHRVLAIAACVLLPACTTQPRHAVQGPLITKPTYTIGGDVPPSAGGSHALDRTMTIADALLAAGFTPDNWPPAVVLSRRTKSEGPPTSFIIEFRNVMRSTEQRQNLSLCPGDFIWVPIPRPAR